MGGFDAPLVLGEAIFTMAVVYGLSKIFGFETVSSFLVHKTHSARADVASYAEIYPSVPTKTTQNPDQPSISAYVISEDDNEDGTVNPTIKYELFEDLNSSLVTKWVSAQRQCYRKVIEQEKYSKRSAIVNQRYQKYFNNGIKVVYSPFQKGKFYFYYKKDKTSDEEGIQPSLYYTKDIRQEGKLVLDARQLVSKYGAILRGTWISDDGGKLAYGVSDWYRRTHISPSMHMVIYVRDVTTGEDSEMDTIYGCRVDGTAISWLEGHIGFFYTRYYYPQTSVAGQPTKYVLGKPCVYFHRMRTEQSKDLMVFEDTYDYPVSSVSGQEPSVQLVPIVSPDGHYLLIEEYNLVTASKIPICQQSLSDEIGSPCPGNRVHFRKLNVFDGKRLQTLGPIQTLVDSSDYRFEYIVNIQDKFWFRTNYLAPGFRVVQIYIQAADTNWPYDIASSSSAIAGSASKSSKNNKSPMKDSSISTRWKKAWTTGVEYIPEHREGGILVRSYIASETVMLLQYVIRGCHEVMIYDLLQAIGGQIPLTHPVASLPHPQFGAVTSVHASYHSDTIFYEFSNLADPGSVYRAVVRRSHSTGFVELSFDQLCRANIPGIDLFKFDIFQDYVTDISETAQIPIFLFGHQDNLCVREEEDAVRAPRPCIVFAYGSFGVLSMPTFSLPLLLFLKSFNAIVCIVGAQGGGESGRVWHSRGHGKFKHRPIDDVVVVSEYLINKRFTCSKQLTLFSGSLGGFISARAATRRPDLFSAVVIDDGVFDLFCNPLSTAEGIVEGTPDGSPIIVTDEEHEDYSSWKDEIGCLPNLTPGSEDYIRLKKLSPLHCAGELFQRVNENVDTTQKLSMSESLSKYTAMKRESQLAGSSKEPEVRETSSSVSSFHSANGDEEKEEPLPPIKLPPAVLLCTATDSAIHPSHTYKYISELQRLAIENSVKDVPFITRIESEEDRQSGNFNDMFISKYAEIFSFIATHTEATNATD